jgi:DNA-binding NarL/FixJ family response regulator
VEELAQESDRSVASASTLLEREGELRTIGGALALAADGAGRPVLIAGPPGIGKTRLAQAAVEQATMAGFRICSARATELERGFPFGLVRQLFEPVLAGSDPERTEVLLGGAAAPALAVFEPPDSQVAAPPDPEYGHLHGLYWLAANLADEGPLVLAIDDAQWADQASTRFLSFIAPRLDGLPLLLLLSSRSTQPGVGLRSELTEHPDLLVIHPPPLSESAVANLVGDRLGEEVARNLAAACHRASGGNPFLLSELLHELGEHPDLSSLRASDVGAMGPERVARSVNARVRRLGEEAERVAEAVAVLGDRAEPRHAAQLSELPDDQIEELADALAEAHVLQPVRPLSFAHPILQAAVYQGLAEGPRGAAHARAARFLYEAEEVDAAALHLVSAPVQGEDWALDCLQRAAMTLARGEPSTARELLQRALAERPRTERRARILFELARAAGQAGEADAIDLLNETAALARNPRLRTLAAIELAMALHFLGRGEEAIDVAAEAIAEIPADEPALGAPLQALLLIGAHHATSTRRKTVDEIGLTAERAQSPDASAVALAHAALERAVVDGDLEQAAEFAERAFLGGLIDIVTADFPSVYACAYALSLADRYEATDRWLTAAIAEAQSRGSARGFAPASAFRAWNAYRAGNLREAEADATASIELLAGDHIIRPVALGALILTLIERGEIAEAQRVQAGFDPAPLRGDLFSVTFFDRASSALALAVGDGPRALIHLDRVAEWELAMGYRGEAWIDHRPLRALALRLLGRQGDALREAAEAVELTRALGSRRALGASLRVLAQVSNNGDREERLRESASVLAASGARLEHAHTLVALGSELRREGRRRESRESLDQGLDFARRCGATALVERAYEELAAASMGRRKVLRTGVDELTASELRVARMAATGKTNRAIAQDLFVTVKTVEFHLRNAYRKLEISSRRELGALLGEAGPPAT